MPMKKRLLLSLLVLSGLLLQAQQVLIQQFDGTFPPTGWTIDAHAANWSAEQSTYAGGTAPEAVMSWSPEFNGMTRLISPEIDMTGASAALLQFKHFIDHYSGNYQIGVATRSNGGAWTNAWTKTVTASIDAITVMVPINDANVNSSTFQFCIFFNGNSYNINSWSVDDIILSIPYELDGAVTALNVPTYFVGSTDVKGTIANVGTSNIVSFKLNWQLNDGEVKSDIIVGQNIAIGQTYDFTSTHTLTPEPGVHNLKVWLSTVNGTTIPDNDPLNDTMAKTLRIPTQTVARMPFFEEFTSSTCGPCASFNNSVFNPFLAQNEEELVYVKYQMDWPGAGDPYYTEEGGVRRAYYGVNAVPMLYVDGKNVATTSPGVNAAFTNSLATPAFIDIDSYYAIDGNNVIIKGQFISYADLVDATLHIVVFEGITTQNVASNGETEFHHVMMRLLPDGYGTSIATIQNGEPFQFEHNVDMSTTNVEEMDDLQVAIFLQDNVTKEIFQAAYADLSGVGVSNLQPGKLSIYPNPVNGEQISVRIPESMNRNVKIEVRNSMGSIVDVFNVANPAGIYSFGNVYSPGLYTIRVYDSSNQVSGKFICIK